MVYQPRVLAIGEIGLDFYRDLSPRPAQYGAFRAQLRLAAEVGLPVVIHCRDAYPETMDLLEAEAGETTIICTALRATVPTPNGHGNTAGFSALVAP